jgi:hypothetical protein
MNVHVFTEDIVGPDSEARVLTFVLEILRLKANGGERKKPIILSNRRRPLDDHVRFKPAAVSDRHTITDAAVRTDEHIRADFRFGTDDGGCVNHKGRFRLSDCGLRM